jgi:hypothetical protein
MQIGTAGVGFVAVNPYAVANGVPGNLLYGGIRTDSTYAGNTYNGVIGTAGTVALGNDSPYLSTDIGIKGIQYRPVGCGVRIRYTGIEFNRAGRCIAYRQAMNQDAPNGSNGDTLLLNREATISPSDRKYHYVTFRPAVPNDVNYNTFTSSANFSMLLYVDGAVAATSFEYDIIWWFEITGSKLPNLTRSHADPIGMAAVTATLPLHQPSATPEVEHRNFLQEVVNTAQTAFSFLSPIVNSIGGVENILPIASAMFL